MTKLYQRLASEVGIQPIYIYEGSKNRGLSFFLDVHISHALGGQCAHCHTVIWAHGRLNRIIAEPYPDDLPDTGPEYRAYYQDSIKKFLDSLPTCPQCGHHNYDRFITNSDQPRFPDGTYDSYSYDSHDSNQPIRKIEKIDPSTVQIWWWEDDISHEELRKRLGR